MVGALKSISGIPLRLLCGMMISLFLFEKDRARRFLIDDTTTG